MKNKLKIYLLSAAVLFSGMVTMSACGSSKKSGCPAEAAHSKPDRKGNYSTKRGQSNLFPKSMRKKMR